VINLIRAESLKLAKRKLYWTMLAILAVVLSMTAFLLLVFPRIAPEDFGGFSGIAKPDAYGFGAAQALGQTWFPVILGAVLLAGETGTTVWASALTRESRRWMHLIAKLLVTGTAAWAGVIAAIGGWALVTAVAADGSGSPELTEWMTIFLKAGISEFTWVSIAFAAAALFRSVGPAIGASLALTFGDQILAIWEPWQGVSLTVATNRLVGDFSAMAGDFGGLLGSEVSFAHALVVVCCWAVLGFGVAAWGLQVRDP